jgi:hypothetical protein
MIFAAVLTVLMICWPSPGGYDIETHSPLRQVQSMAVTLTDIHPSGSFLLSFETLLDKQVLRIPILELINPSATPFQIVAHLIVCSGKSEAEHKVWIGDFSPYPATHAGTFELSISTAARQFESWKVAAGSAHAILLLELKPVHKNDALTSVKIELGTPEWRNTTP